MRLYTDGKLAAAQAQDGDARAALARLKAGAAGEVELVDLRRGLSLRRDGDVWFLEVADGARMRYGMVVDETQATESLDVFLAGILPVPEVAPLRRPVDGRLDSVIVGDDVDEGCPLCRMMGLDAGPEPVGP